MTTPRRQAWSRFLEHIEVENDALHATLSDKANVALLPETDLELLLVLARISTAQWGEAIRFLEAGADLPAVFFQEGQEKDDGREPRRAFFGEPRIASYLADGFGGTLKANNDRALWLCSTPAPDAENIVRRMTGAWKGTPLETGDYLVQPATFSRFILPFAYQLTRLTRSVDRFYQERDPTQAEVVRGDENFERLHYLTPDTSQVLFKRARWFALNSEPDQVTFRSHQGELRARLRPPEIVLFEGRDAMQQSESGLLHTGFLIIDVDFPKESEMALEDLQLFNERFRYWCCPFERHRSYYRWFMSDMPVPGEDQRKIADLDDPYFDRWQAPLLHPVRIDGKDYTLFPKSSSRKKSKRSWDEEAVSWVTSPVGNRRGWVVHADNRAWVWTCAQTKEKVERVDARWIRLLNVDPPSPWSAGKFEIEWAKKRTYRRWEEFGSLYGFSMHSGVMLSPPESEPPLWRHFHSMYFDHTLLLLYSRVSTMRFSNELSRVSEGLTSESGDRQHAKRFREVRRQFAYFTNLYQFPLVSNQQQGIEMYTLAREHLDVGEFFEEIEQEIQATHEMIELWEQSQQTRVATKIASVGAIGLALAVATGFLGMNIVVAPDHASSPSWSSTREWQVFGLALLTGSLLLPVLTWLVSRYLDYDSKRQAWVRRFLVIVMIICILAISAGLDLIPAWPWW